MGSGTRNAHSSSCVSKLMIMNKLTQRIGIILLSVLFAVGAQAVESGNGSSAEGTISSVSGRVTINKAGGGSVLAAKGVKVGEGDTIVTGSGSTVVNLGVHGIITVEAGSEVVFDELKRSSGEDGNTVIDLKKGGIFGNVKKISSNSKYEVKTAKGVAGIRGTAYQILAVGIFKCGQGQLNIVLFALDPQGRPKVFAVRAGSKLDATAVLTEVTNMDPTEAAAVVETTTDPEAEQKPTIIVNSNPVTVDIQLTGQVGNRQGEGGRTTPSNIDR